MLRFTCAFCLGTVVMFLCYSCSGDTANGKPSEEIVITEGVPDTSTIPLQSIAICVWSEAGLREEAGRKKLTKDGKNNYLVTIIYGERVEMLGEEQEVEGRNYMKVRLQDAQEGWVHDYLFEKNAQRAAMTDDAEIYRRPDFMTLRDDQFKRGEIVAVIEKQGDWIHVSGREKKKKGWIKQGNNMSMATRDVEVALRYYMAMEDNSPSGRRDKLIVISEDTSLEGSILMGLVDEALLDNPAETEQRQLNVTKSNQEPEVFITANDTLNRRRENETIEVHKSTGIGTVAPM